MLVLSRNFDQAIIIGDSPNMADNIIVRVVDIRGDKVRLGITCDTSIPVHREEIYNSIMAERTGVPIKVPQKARCGVCGSMSVRRSSMNPKKVICNDCGQLSTGVVSKE